jgi:4-amino-4-deoxy-L-arabinose transferase-like glycosyltransferase
MATETVRSLHRLDRPYPARGAQRSAGWLPYALALFFALLSLRGAASTDITDTDAARHAMNGAFLYDLVHSGHLWHPLAYAQEYYGRFPALSLPFHPPAFPAIEAVFFAFFGVHLLAARFAVALCVAISAALLYRLVQSTTENDLLAACVTASTFSTWTARLVATDVMLEFPSLVFTLGALYCLRNLPRGFTTRRAILYGILGAAALWTKQHAVFLGGVPILYALFSRRWRMLLEKPVWIATAMIAAAIGGLVALSAPFNFAGANRVSTSLPSFWWNLGWNVLYYRREISHALVGLPAVFILGCLAAYLYARRRGIRGKFPLALYFAWALAIPPLLLLVSAADVRYLLYQFPALFTIGYAMLWQGGAALWGEKRAWIPAAGMAVLWLGAGLLFQPEFLHGPAAAAALVEQGAPVRIIYAGEADGNFAFAARALDPKLQTTIIPADKLPRAIFAPAALESFCRFYAIDWIIFEDVPVLHSWSDLRQAQAPSMRLEASLPLDSTRWRWQGGNLKVYRFLAPGPRPNGVLRLPVLKLGRSIKASL